MAFLPILFSPSARPTDTVVLPIPALVAVIAVMLGIYKYTRPETVKGAKEYAVTVVHSDGAKAVFLLDTDAEFLADALLGDGSLFTYNGNAMYYSEAYGAWAYLVIADQKPDTNQVRSQVKISTQTDRAIMYSGDVDGNGSVDMNDARLIQDLYQAKYDTFDTITMMKYLRADVNGDRKVDIRDVAWVTWKILGK